MTTSALANILANDLGRSSLLTPAAPARSTASAPALPTAPASSANVEVKPCARCGSKVFWCDYHGHALCVLCDPPPTRGMVKKFICPNPDETEWEEYDRYYRSLAPQKIEPEAIDYIETVWTPEMDEIFEKRETRTPLIASQPTSLPKPNQKALKL